MLTCGIHLILTSLIGEFDIYSVTDNNTGTGNTVYRNATCEVFAELMGYSHFITVIAIWSDRNLLLGAGCQRYCQHTRSEEIISDNIIKNHIPYSCIKRFDQQVSS